MGCSFSWPKLEYEMAGIKRSDGKLVLDTQYKQPLPFMIYYGELEYSGLTDYSVYGMMVSSDQTAEEVAEARASGTKIFQYIPFGSRFDTDDFLTDTKSTIYGIAQGALGDGIFFDECEVGYWGNYYEDDEMASLFEAGLAELCDYCHSLGLEVIVNGVAAYSDYGDYFLWESFAGNWNTNKINWTADGAGTRKVNSDSTIEYTYPFSDWTLTGTLSISNGAVVNGTEGTMTIDIDMSGLIQPSEQHDTYAWVYFEWFGSGADDDTLEIYAYTGNSWPFDEDTWEELPKLWKGEPGSWDGINKETRYLRIELRFDGAADLNMESCFVAYDYVYPYYDMTAENGAADTNPRYWNYNMAQAEYLWGKGSHVICHSYGTPEDATRMMYSFAAYKTFNFDSWDYTHPLHQTIRYTDILDDPFGAFMSRTQTGTGKYHGVFTGCETDIDVKNNICVVTREEPEYWFDRGIDEFEEVNLVYQNPLSFTHHVFPIQAEIADGETIPGEADGWYVEEVIDPAYLYDADGNIIEGDYYYTVIYYPILPDSLNLRKAWLYDDIFYFYIGLKFKGAVDFLADEPDRYYVYIGTEELDYGFSGEWYTAPFKAQFMIYNQSLFKWDKDAEDETDYTNFHYIGNAFLSYTLTEDSSMLTYTLKKSVLGEGSQKEMGFYLVLEQTAQSYVALVPPTDINPETEPVTFPEGISYAQRRFGLYSPHGYYRSEEIKLKNVSEGLAVRCIASTDDDTDVKLFVRVKEDGADAFGDYEEAAGLTYQTEKTVSHVQYAVSLNSSTGLSTPAVSDVQVIPGDELEPEEYTEKKAVIYATASVMQRIDYEH